jgi:probable F420-dependent oxidoreductase
VELGKVGVWWSGSWGAGESSPDVASELEALGYGTLWSSGRFDPGISSRFGKLLETTSSVTVASGIISIWPNEPDQLAADAGALEARFPGRFLLGLGASHGEVVPSYARPFTKMVGFLDGLDSFAGPAQETAAVAPGRRVLAALGPRMLRLARERSLGAHPYFVPAEHTARAREILGPEALLAPEVTVVLDSDPISARELARSFTTGYLALPNYANNLRSLGFGEDDLRGGGSDRLVDAVVCWGDLDQVARKARRHHEAGADHVCIQVVGGPLTTFPIDSYRALAPALLG